MSVLVDSNVILDLLTEDARWADWSRRALEQEADRTRLVINPIVFAEISVRFSRIEDLEAALPKDMIDREALPFGAAFLAAKVFQRYRKKGGKRTSTLPDFLIGAHAAVAGYDLLTRDVRRYRTYFPTLTLIAP
jgi:predicted nucleic acid-binding protein